MTDHADWDVSKYILDTKNSFERYWNFQWYKNDVFGNFEFKNVRFWAQIKVIEIPNWGNQFINDAFHAREQKLHEGKKFCLNL